MYLAITPFIILIMIAVIFKMHYIPNNPVTCMVISLIIGLMFPCFIVIVFLCQYYEINKDSIVKSIWKFGCNPDKVVRDFGAFGP